MLLLLFIGRTGLFLLFSTFFGGSFLKILKVAFKVTFFTRRVLFLYKPIGFSSRTGLFLIFKWAD